MKWLMLLLATTLFLVACGAIQQTNPDTPATNTAPTATPKPSTIDLPDLGEAPDILNEIWLNTDQPLTLASQKGKVVLVEFWTFGCINCKRVIPHVQGWYETYSGDEFTVLSVHYPEFNYEHDINNVANALVDLGVTYPVAIDNDRETWAAYTQRYWPTTYLVDKNGRLRYKHIGEGNYTATEQAIQTLINE